MVQGLAPPRVLVVGGTGRLGRAIVARLLRLEHAVRVMTRDPAGAEDLREAGAEIVRADLREPATLPRAVAGETHVVTTANAFMDRARDAVEAIDVRGNQALIDAARDAGVRQFVFTSALIRPEFEAIDFFAAKMRTERYLRESGIPFTILRPTAFMEIWAAMLGEPVFRGGRVSILGPGTVPMNFVAIDDVADVAVMTLDRTDAVNAVIEIGGPDNLTQNEAVDVFERVAGRSARRAHVPVLLMRMMPAVLRAFNPALARQMQAGAVTATTAQTFAPTRLRTAYGIAGTTLQDWAGRYAARLATQPPGVQ